MKRFWKIALATLLLAVSTTDVASACGLTRGLFGRRCAYRVAATYGAYGGSTAGSVSRDLPTCSGDGCDVEKKDDAAAPTCSGDACEAEKPTDDAETTAVPTCAAETCETSTAATTCETLALSEQEVALGLRLVEAANRSRIAKCLPPLELDERFADGARSHSRLMARWRSCFHRYPPTPEICAAWQTSPEAAVRAWEFSADHKAIMHGARYTKVAPGVAYDAEGRLYWTLRIW